MTFLWCYYIIYSFNVYTQDYFGYVSNFISRMFGTLIHIGMYDVIFVFVQDAFDSRNKISFLTQLFILLGKYHIGLKNWLKLSQIINILLKKLNNMVLICTILETEKLKRPGKDLIFLLDFDSFLSLYTLCFFFYYCCEMYMFVLICT